MAAQTDAIVNGAPAGVDLSGIRRYNQGSRPNSIGFLTDMPTVGGYQIVANMPVNNGVAGTSPTYYAAYNKTLGTTDYVIGPNYLQDFLKNHISYEAQANLTRAPDYVQQTVAYQTSLLNGDFSDAGSHFLKSYAAAATDPGWLLQMGTGALGAIAAGGIGATPEAVYGLGGLTGEIGTVGSDLTTSLGSTTLDTLEASPSITLAGSPGRLYNSGAPLSAQVGRFDLSGLVPEGASGINPASTSAPLESSGLGVNPTGSQWYNYLSEKYGAGNVTWAWPANQGFVYGADTFDTLASGQLIGRFGSESGTFAAPYDTAAETLLPRPGSELGNYNVYNVEIPLPNVRIGPAAPAFDMPGYGTQFQLPMSVSELLQQGYLSRAVNR